MSVPTKLAGPVICVPYPVEARLTPASRHAVVTVGEEFALIGVASNRHDFFAYRYLSIFTFPVMLLPLPVTISPNLAVEESLDSSVKLSLVVMAELVTLPYKSADEINNVSFNVGAIVMPLEFAFMRVEIFLPTNQLPAKFWAMPDVPFISTIPTLAFINPPVLFNMPAPLMVIFVLAISKVPCFKRFIPFTSWLVAMVTDVGLSIVKSLQVVDKPLPVICVTRPL